MVKWYVETDFASAENKANCTIIPPPSEQNKQETDENKARAVLTCNLVSSNETIQKSTGRDRRNSSSDEEDFWNLSFKIEEITSIVDAAFAFCDPPKKLQPQTHDNIYEVIPFDLENQHEVEMDMEVACVEKTEGGYFEEGTFLRPRINSTSLHESIYSSRNVETHRTTSVQDPISLNDASNDVALCRRYSANSSAHDPAKRHAVVDLLDFDINALLDGTLESSVLYSSPHIAGVSNEWNICKNNPSNRIKQVDTKPNGGPNPRQESSAQKIFRALDEPIHKTHSKSHDDLLTPKCKRKPQQIQGKSDFDKCIKELVRMHSFKKDDANTNETQSNSNRNEQTNQEPIKNYSKNSNKTKHNKIHYPPIPFKKHTLRKKILVKNTSNPKFDPPNEKINHSKLSASKICLINDDKIQHQDLNKIPHQIQLSSSQDRYNYLNNNNMVPVIQNLFTNRELLLESLLRTLSSEAWKLEASGPASPRTRNPLMNHLDPESANECQVESKSLIDILESNLNVGPDPGELAAKKLARQVKQQALRAPPKASRLLYQDYERLRQLNRGRKWANVVSTIIITCR